MTSDVDLDASIIYLARMNEIRDIVSEISPSFSELLNFVNQKHIQFTNPNESHSNEQIKKIINTIIYLSQFISADIKSELEKCKTSIEKAFIIDKYFGLNYLDRKCADFILDMSIIFDEIIKNSDFSVMSNGKILLINGKETNFHCNKSFTEASWQNCTRTRNRFNRTILNIVENIFTKEYDRIMLESLIKRFNFFIPLVDSA